jgi:hypothetical protein
METSDNRLLRILPASLAFLLLGPVMVRAIDLPTMNHLKGTETLQQAELSVSEVKQVLGQVKLIAYDTPESWQEELRVRRVSLGSVDGLVLQGTSLLCGATGNCQTWVFRRIGTRWVCLFRGQAPVASGFGFEQQAKLGIRNLVLSSHVSSDETDYAVFTYTGRVYSSSRCYHAIAGHSLEVACK